MYLIYPLSVCIFILHFETFVLIHAIKIESFFIRQILSSSLVIHSLILDENDGKRASNSVSIIDLDNAASKSIDMSNTDIENIRNDAVDVEKLYSEIE
ncbi:hypothetical protein [Staphylococcus nepalensis]|uniref:hypothetical protein n=1 Tax=Staphylococcus nepalensis TaxID=214473 RepID=UPI0031BA84D6